MLFSVPQYIDIEDKVAGPLTAKQLGWLMLMGVILLILWKSMTSKILAIMVGFPVAMIFLALAFVKPYGQTLISFVFAGISYAFNPKVYVWNRTSQAGIVVGMGAKQKAKKMTDDKKARDYAEKRRREIENIEGLAKIVDSRGSVAEQDVIEILKKTKIINKAK